MRALWKRPGALAALLALAYLLGAAVGVAFIGLYPIYVQQKPGLISHARTIAREYLQGSEEEIRRMLGTYTQILIYDENGVCVRFEPADAAGSAEELAAYTARWLADILAGEEIFAITDSLFSVEPWRFWLTSGVPVPDGDTTVGAVFLIQNLQNVQEAAFAYLILYTVVFWIAVCLLLTYAKKKRKLEELQRNYVANVTHALKTPIASIHAMAEALGDGVVTDPDKQRIYYGLILQETNHQSRMVREMLELSKLQSDGVDFTKSEVDAAALFAPIAARYAPMFDCTDVTLHMDEAILRLPALYTNAAQIEQVMEILLDNAIKFVPEGGDVWIEAHTVGNHAVVCVRDNGIGIAGTDLPHVFERFYRCDRSDTAGGSGLGLAIAREIVDGLKEKIWVESGEGEGTAFLFTVRLK